MHQKHRGNADGSLQHALGGLQEEVPDDGGARNANCWTHAIKALRGPLLKHMTGKTCDMSCGHVTKANKPTKCDSVPKARFKADQAHSAAFRLMFAIDEGVRIVFPEKDDPSLPRVCDAGSPERRARRSKAVVYVRRLVFALALHLMGIHDLCTHAELPADHAAMKCNPQRRYLASVLLSFSKLAPRLLTVIGKGNINYCESDNAAKGRERTKAIPWPTVNDSLAVNVANMETQQLRLATAGHYYYPRVEIADLLRRHWGLNVHFTMAEMAAMRNKLQARADLRARRNTPAARSRRKAARVMKLMSKSKSKDMAYVSLSSENGLRAAGVLFDFHGGESVVSDDAAAYAISSHDHNAEPMADDEDGE